jgi:hypothetical protein
MGALLSLAADRTYPLAPIGKEVVGRRVPRWSISGSGDSICNNSGVVSHAIQLAREAHARPKVQGAYATDRQISNGLNFRKGKFIRKSCDF